MDLKLHFVLLRRPIYVAIHRVLWAHFCLALSTVWPPQQSQGVSVLGCWHFPLPNLSTHSVVNGQLADYGRMEHRVTLSTGFKEDKHVEGWRCVMHHSGVKHTQGCDTNYTLRESLQQGRSGDLACTGCWTWPWRDISGRTAPTWPRRKPPKPAFCFCFTCYLLK